MKIIMFDVDETLQCGGGPVPHSALVELRRQGHIVGICGNWALALNVVPKLLSIVTFAGPMVMPKDVFLGQIKQYIRADEYVMVGNILGVSGASDDQGAAHRAGWLFLRESQWEDLFQVDPAIERLRNYEDVARDNAL